MKADSPKTDQKGRKILREALKVFAKEGFRNADVQVIADLAGVGKGTVYRHFGNKEQLFLATSRHCLTEAGEFIQREVLAGRDPIGFADEIGAVPLLRRIATAYAQHYQRQPEAVEIMIQERSEFRETVFPSHLMHRAEHREGLDELLRRAVERGELRAVDVTQATDAFADLLFGTVVNGCLSGGKTSLVARVEGAVELFLHGLAARDE